MSAAFPGADVRDALEVEASLVFSGSERLALSPFAQSTTAVVTSDWPHPSFDGSFLPDRREISDEGFEAEWSVPYLARGAAGSGDAYQAGVSVIAARDLGVSLVQPMDVYVSINRALKYAVMFIGIVFLAFFLFEVTSGKRAHAAQYVLIGLAQAIFYVMLLAFAEHLDFAVAFALAAGLTVAIISVYAGSIYGSCT
jgi:inner membrane protein